MSSAAGAPRPGRAGGLPRVGFGAAPIGNLFDEVDDAQATAAVHAALDAGIRFFDTAPHYGAGLSEQRLGRALEGVSRESVDVATKVGRRIERDGDEAPPAGGAGTHTVGDLSRDGVLRSLEGSLARLGLDHVDVLYLHDPSDVDEALRGAWPALLDLREQGVVGRIGVGMNEVEPLCRFVREADPDVVMVAGRLTLLNDTARTELLPIAAERGVALVAAGVFNSGVLADPRAGSHYDYRSPPAAVLRRAQDIGDVCARFGVPLVAAAAQYPLLFPSVGTVVLGMRSADEVAADLGALAHPIPHELWETLAERGLVAHAGG